MAQYKIFKEHKKMPITEKQLQDYQDSAEVLAKQVFESMKTLSSALDWVFDDINNTVLASLERLSQDVAQVALSSFTQQFEESINAVVSQVAQQLDEVKKDYFTEVLQATFRDLERYMRPAYIPLPPTYLRQPPLQLPPQVKYINGRYVYIDDYKPGLN